MTTASSTLRIGLVYPGLLGTYGDRGNAAVLADRAQRRGLAAEVVVVEAGRALPATLDVYVLGGGEDRAELLALDRLQRRRHALSSALAAGAQIVAVCAGFQMLGTSITGSDGVIRPGLGLLDAVTHPGGDRLVGEVLVETGLDGVGAVSGFENHAAVTELGAGGTPLGRITAPATEAGRLDGAIAPGIVATYLHGPVLARNPELADHVLEQVVGPLAPLTHDRAATLHEARHLVLTRRSRRLPRPGR